MRTILSTVTFAGLNHSRALHRHAAALPGSHWRVPAGTAEVALKIGGGRL